MENLATKYEVNFSFDWKKNDEPHIEEYGTINCDSYEQALAVFTTKSKELSQRVLAIGEYSYVNATVKTNLPGSLSPIDFFNWELGGYENLS